MKSLGSRLVSSSWEEKRGYTSCRTISIRAYGGDRSSQRGGGGGGPTMCFEYRRFLFTEFRKVNDYTTIPQHMDSKKLESVESPKSFSSDMELATRPEEFHSWFGSVLSRSGFLPETRDLIRAEMAGFGQAMGMEATRNGFSRLDFLVEAQDVVALNAYAGMEEDSEEYSEDDEEMEEEREEEMEEEMEEIMLSGMVPAAGSAIERLKSKTLISVEESEEKCAICLNKLFVADADATLMPCKHIFHQECIVEWLERSHMCPICRFKMPI
ncbi:hypothetical protein H6P81_006980 [Aristolochia fimbriata]|uniref:RING-type domain-containing protein n=1 Tax=Aristolochia fimbriata TaxID=158543 RepID=A0AAV7F1L2_ARIFI|nr:hypothetical protein H6P81_006980 [Aristolochia fimbriata]